MERSLSRSGRLKKFEFLRPFRKASKKPEKNHVLLWISLILNWKWEVCLQQPTMFCLSNSNVYNFLLDLGINSFIVYQNFKTTSLLKFKYYLSYTESLKNSGIPEYHVLEFLTHGTFLGWKYFLKLCWY